MDERSLDKRIAGWIALGRSTRECGYPAGAIPLFLRVLRLAPGHVEARAELETARVDVRWLQGMVSLMR